MLIEAVADIAKGAWHSQSGLEQFAPGLLSLGYEPMSRFQGWWISRPGSVLATVVGPLTLGSC